MTYRIYLPFSQGATNFETIVAERGHTFGHTAIVNCVIIGVIGIEYMAFILLASYYILLSRGKTSENLHFAS